MPKNKHWKYYEGKVICCSIGVNSNRLQEIGNGKIYINPKGHITSGKMDLSMIPVDNISNICNKINFFLINK